MFGIRGKLRKKKRGVELLSWGQIRVYSGDDLYKHGDVEILKWLFGWMVG